VRVPGTKNPNALRTVGLSAPAIRALNDLPRPLDASLFVFRTEEGAQIDVSNWTKHHWRPALAKAGLAYRPPKEMRHTYATLALGQGATIEWISKQMGHSNIAITLKYYARFVQAVDDRMIALLDQMEPTDEMAIRST
jgi:integrase